MDKNIDFENTVVDPQFTMGEGEQVTCQGAIGLSKVTGPHEDNPGITIFGKREGWRCDDLDDKELLQKQGATAEQ